MEGLKVIFLSALFGFTVYFFICTRGDDDDLHRNGNSTVFVEFMLERIDEILDEINVQVRKSNAMDSEYVKRLLDVMEFDIPYSAKALMDLLGLKSRETFRKHYMDPALKQGIVERTIPEKPNSKNQKYIKL